MLKFPVDDRLLGVRLRSANAELRAGIIKRLEPYRKATNTQTYDAVAYSYSQATEEGRAISSSSNLLPRYCPLVELDIARFAYGLPRRRRFFNNYYRQVMTSLNPPVAAIATSTGGMTCSSRPAHVVLDAGRFAASNVRWAARVFSRRALHRPYGLPPVNHPDLMKQARALPQTARAVAALQSAGILADDVQAGQLAICCWAAVSRWACCSAMTCAKVKSLARTHNVGQAERQVPLRIISIVGTRPQLIREAALYQALRARHDEVLIDTGQHYDAPLAGDFFIELALPEPDHSLGIGGGTASEQVGRMLIALEPILRKERADAVLVSGDTNSTLAGGLAAAQAGLPLAHVEAGLRSFDRSMPEENNRVIVDHLARWVFRTNSGGRWESRR